MVEVTLNNLEQFETPLKMIKKIIQKSTSLENFQIRGNGSTRIEALSDAVFALAIAILLISSSVPKNFDELMVFVKDLVPLALCILFIYWIWRWHNTFFLRYGMTDSKTSNLNMVLLFFVLFYVYPLKFLMSWLCKFFGGLLGHAFGTDFNAQLQELNQIIPIREMPLLMIIYGLGFMGIFIIFWAMNRHALRNRVLLELDEIEIFETQFSIKQSLMVAGVGALSILIALIFGIGMDSPMAGFFSGITYNLIWVFSIILIRKRKAGLEKLKSHSS